MTLQNYWTRSWRWQGRIVSPLPEKSHSKRYVRYVTLSCDVTCCVVLYCAVMRWDEMRFVTICYVLCCCVLLWHVMLYLVVTNAYIYISIYIRTHTHAYTLKHTQTHIRTHTYAHTHTHSSLSNHPSNNNNNRACLWAFQRAQQSEPLSLWVTVKRTKARLLSLSFLLLGRGICPLCCSLICLRRAWSKKQRPSYSKGQGTGKRFRGKAKGEDGMEESVAWVLSRAAKRRRGGWKRTGGKKRGVFDQCCPPLILRPTPLYSILLHPNLLQSIVESHLISISLPLFTILHLHPDHSHSFSNPTLLFYSVY